MLSQLELASGIVIGTRRDAPSLPEVEPGLTARAALEEVLRAALERPPCAIAFSGGCDSSALLALAAHVARREGLEPPLPVTAVFGTYEEADETEWQELVIRHLGLTEWVRLEAGEELGVLGPIVRESLLRRGSTWPPNAHLVSFLARAARDGSIITGLDGDTLFRVRRWSRAAEVLGGHVRPGFRDLPRVALAIAPPRVRSVVMRRRPVAPDWLRPEVRTAVDAKLRRYEVSEPLRWAPRMAWFTASRYHVPLLASVEAFAGDHGATHVAPLMDPRFLAALAREGGRYGYPDRGRALEALVGDVLPPETLARTSKADFTRAYFGPEARSFIDAWDGTGAPTELVLVDRLREIWQEARPHAGSWTLLQSCWLQTELVRRKRAGLRDYQARGTLAAQDSGKSHTEEEDVNDDKPGSGAREAL